jgi:hypothetical protein
MRAFYTVDYEEGTDSFEAIRVEFDDETILFNTGDPVIDWFQFGRFKYSGGAAQLGIQSMGGSSSIDHWFMDNRNYVEQYLKEVEEGKFEFMTTKDISELSISEMDDCVKCVARRDMKSFQEVRDYYYTYVKELTLQERLDRAYIKTVFMADIETSFGVRTVKMLRFGDKSIIRPAPTKCDEIVKKEFGITI